MARARDEAVADKGRGEMFVRRIGDLERQQRGEFYDPAMLRQYDWLHITMIIKLTTTIA